MSERFCLFDHFLLVSFGLVLELYISSGIAVVSGNDVNMCVFGFLAGVFPILHHEAVRLDLEEFFELLGDFLGALEHFQGFQFREFSKVLNRPSGTDKDMAGHYGSQVDHSVDVAARNEHLLGRDDLVAEAESARSRHGRGGLVGGGGGMVRDSGGN